MSDANGLADVGKQIERLAVEGSKFQYPQPVTGVKLPPGHVLLQKRDGEFINHDVGAGFRNDRLDTIATAIAFIKSEVKEKTAAVFVNETNVVILQNVDDQRSRAYVPLNWTTQYSMLRKGEMCNVAQPLFVFHLRTTFAEALPPTGPNLAKIFGNIKWATGQSGERVIEHGRDGYGAKVNSAVETGAGGVLPEEVTLSIPIFECMPDVLFPVRCAIDVRPADQKFSIVPYPQQTTRAIESAIAWIVEQLATKDGPPIYRGHPKQGE